MLDMASPLSIQESERFTTFLEWLAVMSRADISVSVPGLGTPLTFNPRTPLGIDQLWIAELYGVDFAYLYTNGTTGLNTLAALTLASEGAKVLVQRNSHVSMYAPIIHAGWRPVYLSPEFSQSLGIDLAVTPQSIDEALIKQPDIELVVLTSPNYFGVVGDIQGCVRVVHAHGKKVLVDSAHGAYLSFHPNLPPAAEHTGAEIVTQSTHKTLSALSQGSLALFNNTAQHNLIQRFYEVVNSTGLVSTSFSYPILMSITVAIKQMNLQGRTMLDRAIEVSEWVRAEVNRIDCFRSFGLEQIGQHKGLDALDPLRVTVDVQALGMTGFEVEDLLIEQYGIYPEMATLTSVLFLFAPADKHNSGQSVVAALRDIADEYYASPASRYEVLRAPTIPQLVCTPREVFYDRGRKRTSVTSAIGGVSCETIAAYPPGSAIIVAGEEVTYEVVEYLRNFVAHGGVLKGASDPKFETIYVRN